MAKKSNAVLVGGVIGLAVIGAMMMGKKKRRSAPAPAPGVQPTQPGIVVNEMAAGPITGFVVLVPRNNEYFVNIPPQGEMVGFTNGPYATQQEAEDVLADTLQQMAGEGDANGDAAGDLPAPTIDGIALETVQSGPITGYIMLLARNDEYFAHIPQQGGVSAAFTNGPFDSEDEAMAALGEALQALNAPASA